MPDTVAVRTLKETPSRLVVQLTGVSDGTGESAVLKVDKSAFLATDGAEPASLDIERIDWVVAGYPHIQLLWDHTADDQAVVLPAGAAELHYNDTLPGDRGGPPTLADPRSAGGTGDILLTSPATATTGRYLIVLYLLKSPD